VPEGVSAGDCLFTAYDADGNSLGCTGLGPEALASVTSVDFAFSVTATGRTRSFETSATFAQRPASST
jgi:hypothetical protein